MGTTQVFPLSLGNILISYTIHNILHLDIVWVFIVHYFNNKHNILKSNITQLFPLSLCFILTSYTIHNVLKCSTSPICVYLFSIIYYAVIFPSIIQIIFPYLIVSLLCTLFTNGWVTQYSSHLKAFSLYGLSS